MNIKIHYLFTKYSSRARTKSSTISNESIAFHPSIILLQTLATQPLMLVALVVLAVALSGQAFGADAEKQVSYPVAIPVQPAPQPTAAPATYATPAPVIRPIEEASTVPSRATQKSNSKTADVIKKKSTAKTPAPKKIASNKNTGDKKAADKTVSKKNTPTKALTEKAPGKAAPAKVSSVKTAPPAEKTSSKNPAPKKVSAVLSSKEEAPSITAASAAEKKTVEIENYSQAPDQTKTAAQVIPLVAAAATPAATLAIPAIEGDAEENAGDDAPLTQILSNDVSGSDLQDSIAEPAPPPPTQPAISAAPLPVSTQRERFVTEFQNYVETKIVPRVPGAALAIIADGKVKVLQAYGVKKVGGRDGINVDTAFRLASVSKTIAGTTAGILVRDGLITWDTLVTSVLPEVVFSNPKYGNQLTLQHIMSQSTGLPTHTGDNYIEDGLSFADVVNRLRYVNFVCPPGKCYAYQNVSLSLLSNIVQKKTGKSYEQYVREKLFAPLGMRSASFGMDGLKATNNYALPHVLTARGWYTEKITENYYRINPAAGANASISDMSRWVLAQMGNYPEVLGAPTLNAIHAHVTKNTPAQSHYGAADGVTDTYYGMGWRVFDYRGDKHFLHHGGYVLGFRSEMVFNPELQIGMVILSNSNKLSGSVIFQFLDAYEDEKRGTRKKSPAAVPAKKKR